MGWVQLLAGNRVLKAPYGTWRGLATYGGAGAGGAFILAVASHESVIFAVLCLGIGAIGGMAGYARGQTLKSAGWFERSGKKKTNKDNA